MTKDNLANNILNKTIYIIIFLIPLLTLPAQQFARNYNILKYVILLICGAILLVLLFLKRKELKFDLIDKTLLVFYLLIILSTIFSIKIKLSILGQSNRYEGIITFTIYFLVYYCGKYYFSSNKNLWKFFVTVLFITSIIGILQYYNIFPIYYLYDLFGIAYLPGFASSTFGNPNFFGSFLAMGVTLSMALYLVKNKKIYLIASYVSFYALIITMTRSAWVGLAGATVFGLIYVIINRKKEIIKRAIYITIGFVIIFIWIFYSPKLIYKFLPNYAQTMSLNYRLSQMNNELKTAIENKELKGEFGSDRIRIWAMVLKAITAKPIFGSGPDTLAYSLLYNVTADAVSYIEDTNTYVDKAHNEYLQIAATIGIPALIVFLAFLAQILSTQKNMNKDNSIFILKIPIIAYLIQAFFNISTIGVAPIFWLLLGLIQNQEFKKKLIEK